MDDDLKRCEICGALKETWVEFKDYDGHQIKRKRPVMCLCDQNNQEVEKDAKQKQDFKHRMKELQAKYGLSDGFYTDCTFELDDRKDPKLSDICRRYVENWDNMRKNGIGILFCGTPGTGKSFYACAIANALLERKIAAGVTNFPRILNVLQAARDRQQYIDALRWYQLLVIDDLGVERESAYAAEQVYSVIDARSRSGLPLIVTTNMTVAELENPGTMQGGRIYDRILEMCPIRLKMTGTSRRSERATQKQKIVKDLLEGSKEA